MAARDSIVLQGLGVAGMVLSNTLALANFPAILTARRSGSLGKLNPIVFPFLCGNGSAWCLYSACKKDPYMFGGNVFGALVGLFYCTSAMSLVKCPAVRCHVSRAEQATNVFLLRLHVVSER